MDAKSRAASYALQLVKSGDVIGLGTGSTAGRFIQMLSEALGSGRLRDVRGVATSVRTEQLAHSLGIPVVPLSEHPELDIAIDGADEVDPSLDLIKGLGGALLREKMIAQAARRFVVIADATKCVKRLGTRSPVPVEVVPFEHQIHETFFTQLGGHPLLRKTETRDPLITDNGNLIYDLHFPDGIDSPAELESKLKSRAGIVETGLFLGICDAVVIADDNEARMFERPS